MAELNASEGCCGMVELYNLGSIHDQGCISKAMLERIINWGIVVFTDNEEEGNGEFVAGWITANKLGTVVETPWTYNPASGNQITGWLWSVHLDAVKQYIAKPLSL